MKKLFALFCAVTFAIHAYADWSLSDDGVLTVTSNYSYSSPSSYPWYSKRSKIKSVVIQESVTSIGSYAFSSCSKLTSIIIPENSKLTSIGYEAFYGCSGLTNISIPESVTSIGNRAFSGCSMLSYNEYDNALYLGNAENPYLCLVRAKDTNITSCSINSNAKVICGGAFYNCSSLTSITIPESVTSIGNGAFNVCRGLTSIVVDPNNKYYDSRNNCNAIIEKSSNKLIAGCQNTVIPNNVTSIGDHAFDYCSKLTSINIPSSVTSIGESAFDGCSSLTSINIPESVTSIGESAFDGCSSLTSITIPESVTSIGYMAFDGCSSLTSITIPESVTSIGYMAFYDCSSLTSITIPESVTSIGYMAFYDCSSLTSINIPSSVTSIGDHAFDGCRGLTSITIPESVTSIGYMAFYGCSSLTSIVVDPNNAYYDSRDNCNAIIEKKSNTLVAGCQNTIIPESVTSIGDWAFYDCDGLTSITIPSSVTSIGSDAFWYCSGLTRVDCGGTIADWLKISFSGYSSNPLEYAHHLYIDGKEVTEVVIPDGVTSIGDHAFRCCWNLTSITIPSSVTSIGSEAFYDCSGLKQVVTENANVSMIKSALGTDKTYIVPCTLYEQYVAAGLTTKRADMIKKEATSATCTADGNSEYYTCPCGKYYRDEFGATEIENGSWVIAAHHLNVVTDNAVAATCTETGLTEGSHCKACHVTLVAQETIAAIGHEWGSWKTTKKATCVAKGKKQRVCSHDASHVDVADIAINSNNHTNVVTDEAVAATCTETGLTEGSHCEACHATVVAQETIAALGHSFTSYIYNNDATTLADGTETAECDHNCGTTDTRTVEGTKLIPTGVGQVSDTKQKVIKTIENGRVVIIRDGKKYDMMGREL